MQKQTNFDVVSILEQALAGRESDAFQEIGTVVRVGDGIARVFGLAHAVCGEVITFDGGARGVALDLDEHFVSVVLLDPLATVSEHERAYRTNHVYKVPVGDQLIGRAINAAGSPIDGKGPIAAKLEMPIERDVPGIVERKAVTRPFETGLLVVDSLIPIGKGQRELLLGGRSTGKTSIVLDMIINQRGKNVICVYVSIGHKQADTARILDMLERHEAIDYTILIAADAHDSALHQFYAPYAGSTVGEYFMERGRDVLVIYDDLSNHAVAYRELSLLLRRPPGREAYPGDIFYVHSRLLERGGQLSDARGGGSMTVIPVAQLLGDDLASYIPTNLISITDGQILLDTGMFNQGVRPAVNIGLSVSRVGGAAQHTITKKMSGQLKLEIAQYEELQAFLQFGSELDKTSRQKLDRGQRAIELIKQKRHELFNYLDQALFLFLLKYGYLDQFRTDVVSDVAKKFASFIKHMHGQLYATLQEQRDIKIEQEAQLKAIAEDFCFGFIKAL